MNSREKELVLAPNQFAWVLDKTKGNIVTYVGPHKVSLSATDSPVIFNSEDKQFRECSLETAIQKFATAPEGWYLILKNPAVDEKKANPAIRSANDLVDLNIGQKVNIPGPITFPLWPGQMTKTVIGHILRSNQYLTVRVYDDEAAKANWKSGVVKTADGEQVSVGPDNLTMGKLLVIKGTEVSFYIPPTGVEVVAEGRDGKGRPKYVRDAVTLERLEYCILLDESGEKRYVVGPKVVFPEPTEVFLEKDGNRKYKAIELNENSGIYLKVIADYTDASNVLELGRHYKTGEELFITGKDQMIYFPRPEHAIIKYGDQTIHHAIAIPKGEARYVLNRQTGDISKVEGPIMFLPDPRKEVIVRRVLSPKQVEMWFPGNEEALAYNAGLAQLDNGEAGYVPDQDLRMSMSMSSYSISNMNSRNVSKGHMGDAFDRKTKYTPPRTITLDTKYDGAVCVNVWTGYAIQVVPKVGPRKVIVGPTSYLLGYDETLEVMELSTGKPKTTDNLLATAYLRYLNNKIGDIIEVQTKDYCDIRIKVSYCVNFEGDPNKWFNADNYVKLLCDKMRSALRSEIKNGTIQEFYPDSTEIIKDIILGTVTEIAEGGTGGTRPGYTFKENGMKVYDVEVLSVNILSNSVAGALIGHQRDVLSNSLRMDKLRQELAQVKEEEDIAQQINAIRTSTQVKEQENRRILLEEEAQTEQNRADIKAEQAEMNREEAMKADAHVNTLETTRLKRVRANADNELSIVKAKEDYYVALDRTKTETCIAHMKGEAEALRDKMTAISPDLIAALQNLGDKNMLEKIAQAMSPMAIVNDRSIGDTVQQLFKGTAMEDAFKGIILNLPSND